MENVFIDHNQSSKKSARRALLPPPAICIEKVQN